MTPPCRGFEYTCPCLHYATNPAPVTRGIFSADWIIGYPKAKNGGRHPSALKTAEQLLHHGAFFFVGKLVDLPELQRFRGAGSGAGRSVAQLHPDMTHLTLLHFAIGIVSWHAERTCNGAAVATDTERFIDQHSIPLRVFVNRSRRAAHKTGGILAMHTCKGNIPDFSIRINPLFACEYPPERIYRLSAFRYFNIVLIHASHRAGIAAAALFRIKVKTIFQSEHLL